MDLDDDLVSNAPSGAILREACKYWARRQEPLLVCACCSALLIGDIRVFINEWLLILSA